jgi:Tol biopolymer transport system component
VQSGALTKLSLALALLVVLSFTLADAGADIASGSASSGRIVFQSSRDGDYDIYSMNPDGTGLTQLTHNDFEDSSPFPSPDGRLIAFYSDDDGFTLINADGSGRRSLEGCGGTDTTWAPDSTRLVCQVEVDYDAGLAVVDVATGTSRLLARQGQKARWSPDGRTIAYVDGGLYVVPAEGGTRRRLGRRRLDSPPSWSPDSQRLAYAGSAGSSYRVDLFTIRADGSGERRLVQRVGDLAPVHWSPVGSRIVFEKWLPQSVRGIYTVRADGTGMRRVGASPGRESSREPMWSADGTALLYARQRYRDADETDVFVTVPNGGVGRALTHPFPAGGSNDDAHWTSGPRLAGGEPAPARIRLPLARKLSFADPVVRVATDGRRAAPFTYSYSDSPTARKRGALIWDAVARRTHRTPVLCGELGGHGGLVLAGKRLAWLCGHAGNTFQEDILMTTRPGARRPKVVADAISYTEGGGDSLENLVGHGSTIAFTHYQGTARERTAWLLVPTHGKKCPGNGDIYRPAKLCRRLSAAAGGVTTAVDAGRVLTVAPDGTVRLLSTSGRLRRTWQLEPGIINARLRGRKLAVQQGSSLDVYDAVTGAKTHTIPLAANEGVAARLLDVQGNLAVYATGGAIHLVRLSDGKDRALSLPGGAPELDAGLERQGLFVSWNRMYSRRPGRVAFVPLRAVKSAFSSRPGSLRASFDLTAGVSGARSTRGPEILRPSRPEGRSANGSGRSGSHMPGARPALPAETH